MAAVKKAAVKKAVTKKSAEILNWAYRCCPPPEKVKLEIAPRTAKDSCCDDDLPRSCITSFGPLATTNAPPTTHATRTTYSSLEEASRPLQCLLALCTLRFGSKQEQQAALSSPRLCLRSAHPTTTPASSTPLYANTPKTQPYPCTVDASRLAAHPPLRPPGGRRECRPRKFPSLGRGLLLPYC